MPSPAARAFSIMAKPRGSICNLECAYCFYLGKAALYPGAQFRMSDALLETYIHQYIEAQPVPQVTFAWQGGEPTLMGLAFFQKALELQEKYRRPGMQISNAFQTNGILLDADWARFFHDHHVLVGLSIDGPAAIHDFYRRDKGGAATHARVLAAARLLQEHQVEFNTLSCVTAASAGRGEEIYAALRDEVGARYMQFIPIVGRSEPAAVSASDYGRFLIDIFDTWARADIGQVFVQIFDCALAAWLGQPAGVCVYEETCGQALAMEWNGDVYACDHYVQPEYRLGNLQEQTLAQLAGLPQQRRFGLAKRDSLPGQCRACDVRFLCNGGCPKDRLRSTASGEPGLNALCAGYFAFYTYSAPAMKGMAALLRSGQPAAQIMPRMAQQTALAQAAPGSPCPCGSGKAVETCHRAAPPRRRH